MTDAERLAFLKIIEQINKDIQKIYGLPRGLLQESDARSGQYVCVYSSRSRTHE